MKIGICDYGIGGLGLYKLLRRDSKADIVYLSDTGYTPYGKVHEDELKLRIEKVLSFFKKLDINHVAIACNAASTVINDNENLIGVIKHAANKVVEIGAKEIAVLGGKRTVESNRYKQLLEPKGISVFQSIGQELSIKIEAGDIDSDELMLDIENALRPIQHIQYILLACTHYPVIIDSLQKAAKNSVFIDPISDMHEWIMKNWQMNTGGESTSTWMTTGSEEQMKQSALTCFNVQLHNVEKVPISLNNHEIK
jgi:glutamate racemase